MAESGRRLGVGAGAGVDSRIGVGGAGSEGAEGGVGARGVEGVVAGGGDMLSAVVGVLSAIGS